jgi:enoyl-CoA hydratase
VEGDVDDERLVVREQTADAVVTLRVNRPERKNALSIALRDELSDHLDVLAVDEAVKVVVVTGAGDVFSAGFDLREFTSDDAAVQRALWPSSDRFHHTLLRFPLPTIAAVNGAALAGGFDLAVLCELRVAARSASFAHVEHTFGDVVYAPLHDLVGGAVARDLCLTGPAGRRRGGVPSRAREPGRAGRRAHRGGCRDRGRDRARTPRGAGAHEGQGGGASRRRPRHAHPLALRWQSPDACTTPERAATRPPWPTAQMPTSSAAVYPSSVLPVTVATWRL